MLPNTRENRMLDKMLIRSCAKPSALTMVDRNDLNMVNHACYLKELAYAAKECPKQTSDTCDDTSGCIWDRKTNMCAAIEETGEPVVRFSFTDPYISIKKDGHSFYGISKYPIVEKRWKCIKNIQSGLNL